MAEMLYGIRAVTSTPVEFTWVDLEFLQEQGVRSWSDMPVWISRDPIAFVRVDRAIAAGLTFRSLADTARDTIDWHATLSPEAWATMRAGLKADREAELLELWHAKE